MKQLQWTVYSESLTWMYESNHFPLDEWKDAGQFPQLSLGVHLPQRRRDEVIVVAVELQILTTVRVRSAI